MEKRVKNKIKGLDNSKGRSKVVKHLNTQNEGGEVIELEITNGYNSNSIMKEVNYLDNQKISKLGSNSRINTLKGFISKNGLEALNTQIKASECFDWEFKDSQASKSELKESRICGLKGHFYAGFLKTVIKNWVSDRSKRNGVKKEGKVMRFGRGFYAGYLKLLKSN